MATAYHFQNRDEDNHSKIAELRKPAKEALSLTQKKLSKSSIVPTPEHPVEQATVVPTQIQSPTNPKSKIVDNSWFDKFPGLNTSEWLINHGYEDPTAPSTASTKERYKPVFYQSSLRRLVDIKRGELIILRWEEEFSYRLRSFFDQTDDTDLVFQNGKYFKKAEMGKIDDKIPFCRISFKSKETFLRSKNPQIAFFVQSVRHPIKFQNNQGIEISPTYPMRGLESISCFVKSGRPNQVSYRDLQLVHLCTTFNTHCLILKHPNQTRTY